MSNGPMITREVRGGSAPYMREAFAKLAATDFLRRMNSMADRIAPSLRSAFKRVLDTAALHLTEQQIEHALAQRGIEETVRVLLENSYLLEKATLALQQAVREAVSLATARWPLFSGGIELDGVTNPVALAFLHDYPVPLVREMSLQMRETLRDLVAYGLSEGMDAESLGRLLRTTKGFSLTRMQWNSVMNYRKELMQGGSGSDRALRDRRFTTTDLTDDKIDRMVERYGERWIDHRAKTIARTESIRALNAGLWLTMDEAVRNGRIDGDSLVRRWIPAPDNATGGGPCPVCLEVAMVNEKGVGMNEPFEVPKGQLMYPPLHPNCRCIVFTRPRLNPNETFSWPPEHLTDAL